MLNQNTVTIKVYFEVMVFSTTIVAVFMRNILPVPALLELLRSLLCILLLNKYYRFIKTLSSRNT